MEPSRAAAAALRLVLRITLGAALFAFLFVVAVGLAYLVHYFEGQGIAPARLIEGARYAEIAILQSMRGALRSTPWRKWSASCGPSWLR